jgi:hypothetical protein
MASSPDPKSEWTTEEIMLAEVSDLNTRKVVTSTQTVSLHTTLFVVKLTTDKLRN